MTDLDTVSSPTDLMSLSEFSKRYGRRPIKLEEADQELAKYGLGLKLRLRHGRYETGYLDRPSAEKVIEEHRKVKPRNFTNVRSDRLNLLEIAAHSAKTSESLEAVEQKVERLTNTIADLTKTVAKLTRSLEAQKV